MTPRSNEHHPQLSRRSLLAGALAGFCAARVVPHLLAQDAAKSDNPPRGKPTEFQIACMTLPYSQFPLARALEGIKQAGFRFIAWGTTHKEAGDQNVPVIAADARPEKAKELAVRCRDM